MVADAVAGTTMARAVPATSNVEERATSCRFRALSSMLDSP